MTTYTMQRTFSPLKSDSQKIFKMLKHKLTPLNESEKYPMGKYSFLNFKNLQKIPKLRKSNVNLTKRKSLIQDNIMNTLITKELDKSQKNLSSELYEHPSSWLKLWKKTGDKFQHQYLTNRQGSQSYPLFPQQTKYPLDFQQKIRLKNSQHTSSYSQSKVLLKKVEDYKKSKKEEIQKLRKTKPKKVAHRSYQQMKSTANLLEESMSLQSKSKKKYQCEATQDMLEQIQNYNETQQHYLKPEDRTANKTDETDGKHQVQTKSVPKNENGNMTNNNQWVFFITQFIINSQMAKVQQDLFFQQFKARKYDNKLKQFISLFEEDKKLLRSCHVEHSLSCLDHSITTREIIEEKIPLKQPKHKYSIDENKENEILIANNPTMKLKRLRSMCKSINSQNMKKESKNNNSEYNCTKLRLNSNHKKIIQTTKFLCKS